MRKIAVYGRGGHAREIAWLLSEGEARKVLTITGYVMDGNIPSEHNGKPVFSFEQLCKTHPDTSVVVAVGDPVMRRELVTKCERSGIAIASAIHSRVERSEFVEIGEGVVVCAGTVVTTNIRIGHHVHINVGCTVSHDVSIGEFT